MASPTTSGPMPSPGITAKRTALQCKMKNEECDSRHLPRSVARHSLPTNCVGQSSHDIERRAFTFACAVVAFCDAANDGRPTTRHVLHELLRAGTSVGANLEEATAGQTKPDFIAKT